MSKVSEAYDLLAENNLKETARCHRIADEHDEFLQMLEEEIPESERRERRYCHRVFDITYQAKDLSRFKRCVECNCWEEALVKAFNMKKAEEKLIMIELNKVVSNEVKK
jgi:hypothetical protein